MGNVPATQVRAPKADSPRLTPQSQQKLDIAVQVPVSLAQRYGRQGPETPLGACGPASRAHSRKKTNNKQQITITTK